MSPPPEESQHLTVKVEGIPLPPWAIGSLLLMTLLSVVALLFVVFYCRDLAREIRVLQVHVQDVENVLIRRGVAKRDDFAAWEAAPQDDQHDEEE